MNPASAILQRPKEALKPPIKASIWLSTFQIRHSSAPLSPQTPSPLHVQGLLDPAPSTAIY